MLVVVRVMRHSSRIEPGEVMRLIVNRSGVSSAFVSTRKHYRRM